MSEKQCGDCMFCNHEVLGNDTCHIYDEAIDDYTYVCDCYEKGTQEDFKKMVCQISEE